MIFNDLKNILRPIVYYWRRVKKQLSIYRIQYQWQIDNKHNKTKAANDITQLLFPASKVRVGRFTYGNLQVLPYGKSDGRLEIGDFCSIANNVKFLLGGGIFTLIF